MHSMLIGELQRVAQAKATGLFFLVSGSNRSAQISFSEGVIVFALCQGKKGIGAIEMIAQMDEIRLRFQEGAIPAARADMPPLQEVIALLSGSSVQGDSPAKKRNVPGAVAKPQTDAAASGKPEFSGQQKQLIRDVLTDCIGPMAIILCEDYLDKVHTMDEALDAIANEIPAQQAITFREEVRRRLQ